MCGLLTRELMGGESSSGVLDPLQWEGRIKDVWSLCATFNGQLLHLLPTVLLPSVRTI